MRIKPKQLQVIKEIICANFGEQALVILFGSRVDDDSRGGDIDLLVEAELDGEALFMAKLKALGELQRALGDQKIDLLTVSAGDLNPPEIVTIAREKGVYL